MSKFKAYAVYCGSKYETARCVIVTETGEQLIWASFVTEEDARTSVHTDSRITSAMQSALNKRNTPAGPDVDPSFIEEHGVEFDGWELEFVSEADRTRHPQIAAMLGLSLPVE